MAVTGDLVVDLDAVIGTIMLRSDPNGGTTVLQADELAAITTQLLAGSCGHLLRVDDDGVIAIAGQVRYRPERLSSDGRSLICRLVD